MQPAAVSSQAMNGPRDPAMAAVDHGTKPVNMVALADNVAQLELDVVMLRQNFAVDRGSLDRLIAIEGQVRTLLTDLAVANGDAVIPTSATRPAAGQALADLAPPLDLLPPSFPRGTAPPASHEPRALARTPQAQPNPPTKAPAAAGGYAAHLASYRSVETLERGWRVLAKANPDLLSDLSYRVGTLDKGSDGGIYYRLKAGPLPDQAAARALCSAFKARKQYCVVTEFAGGLPR